MAITLTGLAPAITVEVDPVSGTDNGSTPFATLAAALTAVAGADAGADTVNLRTTGVHGITGALAINVAAADGNLTIQTDAGDSGAAVIRLGGGGPPQISINVDGGNVLDVNNVAIIGGTGAGAVGADGIQVFNASATGTATVNMTDVTLAANDGTDNPVPFDTNRDDVVGASWPGDDWLDYFEDTAGVLANVKISHCTDEGLILRGINPTGVNGADVVMTGDSVVSFCGGRAFQTAFGTTAISGPTLTVMGSSAERVRVYNNNIEQLEGCFTLFDGNGVLEWVDIVDNQSLGIRVDTDTLFSFSADHLRASGNAEDNALFTATSGAIGFAFAGANLTAATITNSTFHDQQGLFNSIDIRNDTTNATTIDFTDCIFSGSSGGEQGDLINIGTGSTAVVNLTNCALVQTSPFALGSGVYADLMPTSETNSTSVSPLYQSTSFDVNDPTNADFLRVRYTAGAPDYLTASSVGGELRGGNGLPLVEIIISGTDSWQIYN
jgi:hypothetical protein